MANRTKNGIRNIGAGVINNFVLLLFPFFTRTILARTLGSDYLGLSSLFKSILTVLNLSELGIGSAMVYSMYKPVAEEKLSQVGALLHLYKKVYRIIGVVILLAGGVMLPFVPYLINGDVPSEVSVYLLYLIYLFNTAISYFAFAHKKALLIAYQRNDVISNINTVLSAVTYTLQIVLLITLKNYYFYVLVLPIFTLIENLYTAVLVQRRFPNIKECGYVTQEEKSKIKEHVKGIALQKVCSTSRNTFDSIVVSLYLGLTAIASYNNYYFIMKSVHSVLYLIPNSIRSTIGNSVACESVEKNYKDFSTMTMIYMWLSGICCACMISIYQPFMYLWMGEEMLLPFGTVILFCFYFFELCMSDIIALYKDSAGLWWYGRYRTILEAISNLILNFLLGWLWGINGILLATIITILFIGHGYGGYIVFHYYFKGKKYTRYILEQLRYMCVIVVACIVAWWLCEKFISEGFVGIVVRAIISVIVSTMIFFIAFWKCQSFNDAILFLKSIVKKIK